MHASCQSDTTQAHQDCPNQSVMKLHCMDLNGLFLCRERHTWNTHLLIHYVQLIMTLNLHRNKTVCCCNLLLMLISLKLIFSEMRIQELLLFSISSHSNILPLGILLGLFLYRKINLDICKSINNGFDTRILRGMSWKQHTAHFHQDCLISLQTKPSAFRIMSKII